MIHVTRTFIQAQKNVFSCKQEANEHEGHGKTGSSVGALITLNKMVKEGIKGRKRLGMRENKMRENKQFRK